MKALCGVFLLLGMLAFPSVCPADLRQLLVAVANGEGSDYNDRIFRIPLEGPQARQIIEFAGPADGLSYPNSMDLDRNSGRLYVGNSGSGEIIEFEVNADGTKGPSRVFGSFSDAFHSMAIRPSTGRIYIGVEGGSKQRRGIYRMAADGSGFEKVYEETADQDYFGDDCWIAFDPSDDGVIYVTTGYDNQVRIFSVNGADLGVLSGYGDMAIPYPDVFTDTHDEGYWLPHQCFIPAGGGDYNLLLNVHHVPANESAAYHQWKRLAVFSPDPDAFLYELGFEGTALSLPGWTRSMVYDEVSGCIYAGTMSYGNVFEIPADYSRYDDIFNPPGIPDQTSTCVAISYGHSTGADTDGDGLPDDSETGTYGTDPLEADSDTDGLTDYEEVNYDGGDGGYFPYPSGSDTDANKADTDGDGFSDMVEINGGSDPLAAGWTAAAMTIRINFQPPGSTRPDGCSPDAALSYTPSRGYGW